ncbi:MAG: hypothetical protein JW841_06210 [Deltaproteobacteria bacterium]|nr:hypothetical protein [Deltaproteobacteria bacterium]
MNLQQVQNQRLNFTTIERINELNQNIAAGIEMGNIEGLVQSVLRESYIEMTEDLRFFAEKVKYFNKVKKDIRNEIKARRALAASITGEKDDYVLSESFMPKSFVHQYYGQNYEKNDNDTQAKNTACDETIAKEQTPIDSATEDADNTATENANNTTTPINQNDSESTEDSQQQAIAEQALAVYQQNCEFMKNAKDASTKETTIPVWTPISESFANIDVWAEQCKQSALNWFNGLTDEQKEAVATQLKAQGIQFNISAWGDEFRKDQHKVKSNNKMSVLAEGQSVIEYICTCLDKVVAQRPTKITKLIDQGSYIQYLCKTRAHPSVIESARASLYHAHKCQVTCWRISLETGIPKQTKCQVRDISKVLWPPTEFIGKLDENKYPTPESVTASKNCNNVDKPDDSQAAQKALEAYDKYCAELEKDPNAKRVTVSIPMWEPLDNKYKTRETLIREYKESAKNWCNKLTPSQKAAVIEQFQKNGIVFTAHVWDQRHQDDDDGLIVDKAMRKLVPGQDLLDYLEGCINEVVSSLNKDDDGHDAAAWSLGFKETVPKDTSYKMLDKSQAPWPLPGYENTFDTEKYPDPDSVRNNTPYEKTDNDSAITESTENKEWKEGDPIKTKADLDAYLKSLEDELNTVGDDAQLSNVDLQNALQKQQQTLQLMSNISKMLSDTAASIIRKISA